MKRILIMGLPGSGKTYLAMQLKKYLENIFKEINENSLRPINDSKVKVAWLNADTAGLVLLNGATYIPNVVNPIRLDRSGSPKSLSNKLFPLPSIVIVVLAIPGP